MSRWNLEHNSSERRGYFPRFDDVVLFSQDGRDLVVRHQYYEAGVNKRTMNVFDTLGNQVAALSVMEPRLDGVMQVVDVEKVVGDLPVSIITEVTEGEWLSGSQPSGLSRVGLTWDFERGRLLSLVYSDLVVGRDVGGLFGITAERTFDYEDDGRLACSDTIETTEDGRCVTRRSLYKYERRRGGSETFFVFGYRVTGLDSTSPLQLENVTELEFGNGGERPRVVRRYDSISLPNQHQTQDYGDGTPNLLVDEPVDMWAFWKGGNDDVVLSRAVMLKMPVYLGQ